MTREQFHAWMIEPDTGIRLSQALETLSRITDQPQAANAPGPCCATWGDVYACNSVTDKYACKLCGRVWEARCPDQDLWRPES